MMKFILSSQNRMKYETNLNRAMILQECKKPYREEEARLLYLRNRQPDRRLLEMRCQLAQEPQTPSGLWNRIRKKRDRWTRRAFLRSHRPK